MTGEIDITPKTHAINSMRKQEMPAWLAICELVDNSMDAWATNVFVKIDTKNRRVVIADDGVGAPHPAAIVRLGDHDHEDRSTSGRYGIGAKDAALALGTAVEVAVRRNNCFRVVFADFEEMVHTGRWIATETTQYGIGPHSGTTVTVSRVDRRIVFSDVANKLRQTFAPALRTNRRIFVNDVEVVQPEVVAVTDRREGSGELCGKAYSWWAGVKSPHDRTHGGWRFEFKHRMLSETSTTRSYGCGAMDITNFYGVIKLEEPDDADASEKWEVTKHKTSADELEQLCEQIYPQIEDLLKQCEAEHSLTLESQIGTEAGDELTQAMAGVEAMREKRSKPENGEEGTAVPRNTGIRRRRASKVQPGCGSITVTNPLTGRKFRVTFNDSDRFVEVTGNRQANVVVFGRTHPYWQIFWSNPDVVKAMAMSALTGQAVTSTDNNQPIMAALVKADAANYQFFETLGGIASQFAARHETVA
jgi:hypothetical protein